MAVNWSEEVDAALAEAKEQNKPLLIDLSAAPAPSASFQIPPEMVRMKKEILVPPRGRGRGET